MVTPTVSKSPSAEKSPSMEKSPSLLRRVAAVDTAISRRVHAIIHPLLPHSVLKTLEISGDGFFFFPLIISLLLYSHTVNNNKIVLVNLLIGGVLDLAVIGTLKHLVRRPRPFYNRNMTLSFAVDHWSFPSGHSSRVSMIATLVYLNYKNDYEYYLNCIGVIVWALMTCASRVVLGRHFVLDVVAGVVCGVMEGLVVLWILNFDTLSSLFR